MAAHIGLTMLSLKEKIQLNRLAGELKSEIKNGGLNLKERITKTKELAETIKKLKGIAPKAEPVTESELITEPERKTHRYSSSIGAKVKAGDRILNTKMDTWTKEHKAQAALEAAGMHGLAIVNGSDVSGWHIDVLEQLAEGTVLEVIERTTKGEMTIYHHAARVKGRKDGAYKLIDIAKAYDRKAKIVDDYVEMNTFELNSMAKQKGFKLDLNAVPADGLQAFDEELDEQHDSHNESELVTKFKAGGFNSATPATFVEVMRDVHSDGLPLDEVKQGAIAWFEKNPHLILEAA